MIPKQAYSVTLKSGDLPCITFRISLSLFILFSFIMPVCSYSQELPEYDEIAVTLQIPSIGVGDIEALIRGEELYLPVTDLFDFLKIKNTPSPDLETIKGFFINPETEYVISRPDNEINYSGKIFKLEPGSLIRTETNLFLKSEYFGVVFGLDCEFNFRSLSVKVNSKLELPVIREMRQEEMRKNLARLKEDITADTTIGRTYPVFRFGMADGSVVSSQEINGRSDTRLNLALGSMIAGGEATASLYYNSSDPFTEKQQYYLWRYVNNDFAPLRQVMAGKIRSGSIASIYNPVVGVQVTNTPTTYRRSFGTYNLSDRTEPGWIVELYVNNVLVDYIKADASGFFTFDVPLVYGNSQIKLKYYGPWGEERMHEQNISIPYNFLPEKTLEYTLSAGLVEDSLGSRFSRANVNYGITKNLTFGGGAEYLSSVSSGPVMPFMNASLRLGGNLLLSGEYVYGVRTKGILSYRFPSNIQFDQKAIFYNYREERKATLSIPLKIGKFSTYQRLTVYQIVLPASRYTTGEWLLSGSLFGINTNLTTYAMMIQKARPYLYSNLSMAFRLPAGFVLMPQIQYGYTENRIFSAKARVEKRFLGSAFLNLSYEQNFKNDLKLAEVGLRYDFSFAQAGASVRQTNKRTSLIQYARGSLINDRQTKYFGSDNRSNVGRGGITIVPYIDLNNNSKRDRGEPKAPGLNLHSSAGRTVKSDKDSTIRIFGLEPYTNCFIDLDPNSFDNLAWRLPKQTYNIAVDPDIMKLVEVPVSIAGEATGYITLIREGKENGIGRIIVNFIGQDSGLTGRTITERDGYFSFFGLRPGNYSVQPDTAQLRKLGFISDPLSRSFRINESIEGDLAEGLDFKLSPKLPDITLTKSPESEKPVVAGDTSGLIIHEITEKVYTITHDSWAIQIGAFKNRELAESFRTRLEKELNREVEISLSGDFYRVRIMGLNDRKEVDETVIALNKLGFKELWIIRLVAGYRIVQLITGEDSLAIDIEPLTEPDSLISQQEQSVIQLNSFRFISNSLQLSKSLKITTPGSKEPVLSVKGFRLETPEEPILDPVILDAIEDINPINADLGMKESWNLPPPAEMVIEPVRMKPVNIEKTFIPSDIAFSISKVKSHFKLAGKPATGEPTIALQVAIFYNESQAIRAQKRIRSKLGLPVDIVRQFDYYHVIVTGFYTREETIPYYPELAGMGYPGITLIENYRKQGNKP
jgi:hypothetical protein